MTEMSSPVLTDEQKYDAFARAVAKDPDKAKGLIVKELGFWKTDPYKQASRLIKMPLIQELIHKYAVEYQTFPKQGLKDNLVPPQDQETKIEETIEEVFSGENVVTALNTMRSKYPEKFIKAYMDYQKSKIDEGDLGEYNGFSIGDLITETDKAIEETQVLKRELIKFIATGESE